MVVMVTYKFGTISHIPLISVFMIKVSIFLEIS